MRPAPVPGGSRRELLQLVADFVLAGNYYLAAAMLLAAGIMKARHPQVSDLLLIFHAQGGFSFSLVIFLAMWQHWFEILVGVVALAGWQMIWMPRFMAFLYLLFAA